MSDLDRVARCVRHIGALVRAWDNQRGPGMAMPPESVAEVLAGVGDVEVEVDVSVPEDVEERIARAERVLVNVLTDDVYLNDDRDREVIVARMALCKTLQQLREAGVSDGVINGLWDAHECDTWCV